VEPDWSQAGYFWAAAAITGGDVMVKGTSLDMRQGDVGVVRLLESMGCRIMEEPDGLRVVGGKLYAIEADMLDIPDMVPTIAVVAAFAGGKTLIKNISHLKLKESNRIEVVVRELNKMGVNALATDDGLMVEGGRPHGAVIDTYNDHRIAMSFAVAGLAVPGMEIRNPGCVEKSFPNFWEVFGEL
jgi:3-phosphoshikimate 1-carboxyvinyltransferase